MPKLPPAAPEVPAGGHKPFDSAMRRVEWKGSTSFHGGNNPVNTISRRPIRAIMR